MRKTLTKLAKSMKLKKKPIETMRIRKDRAEALKEKCFELSLEAGVQLHEADLVNFLIDSGTELITLEGDQLVIKIDTLNN